MYNSCVPGPSQAFPPSCTIYVCPYHLYPDRLMCCVCDVFSCWLLQVFLCHYTGVYLYVLFFTRPKYYQISAESAKPSNHGIFVHVHVCALRWPSEGCVAMMAVNQDGARTHKDIKELFECKSGIELDRTTERRVR